MSPFPNRSQPAPANTLAARSVFTRETPDALLAAYQHRHLPHQPPEAVFAKSLWISRDVLVAHNRLKQQVARQAKQIEDQQHALDLMRATLAGIVGEKSP